MAALPAHRDRERSGRDGEDRLAQPAVARMCTVESMLSQPSDCIVIVPSHPESEELWNPCFHLRLTTVSCTSRHI